MTPTLTVVLFAGGAGCHSGATCRRCRLHCTRSAMQGAWHRRSHSEAICRLFCAETAVKRRVRAGVFVCSDVQFGLCPVWTLVFAQFGFAFRCLTFEIIVLKQYLPPAGRFLLHAELYSCNSPPPPSAPVNLHSIYLSNLLLPC